VLLPHCVNIEIDASQLSSAVTPTSMSGERSWVPGRMVVPLEQSHRSRDEHDHTRSQPLAGSWLRSELHKLVHWGCLVFVEARTCACPPHSLRTR
jgi:hypothetical protein